MRPPTVDAYSHRLKIAGRFGARIKSGDAVFMSSGPAVGLPLTETGGEDRQFTGMNSLMLLQVMKDNAWQDPRFYTTAQIDKAGWTRKADAKQINLQFLYSTQDGLPLEQPASKLIPVYNASQIEGVPPRGSPLVATIGDVEKAIAREGNPASAGDVRATLMGVLSAKCSPTLSSAEIQLRSAIATTLIEAQTGSLGPFVGAPVDQWVELLGQAPLAMYAAVKDAEMLGAQFMREIDAVAIERATTEYLASGIQPATPKKQGTEMARQAGATARTEALFADRAAVLAVPFSDKDRASALGAVYYAPQSLWFVPPGIDPKLFEEWNPRTHALGGVATDRVLTESFTEAMQSIGLDTSLPIKADGKWHNVPVDSKEKRKNLSGSYIFSLDGARDGGAIGTIINKHTGEQITWRYEGSLLTPEQRARMRQEALAREAAALIETQRAQDAAAVTATEIWDASGSAEGNAYALRKGMPSTAFRQAPGSLLLKYSAFKGESGASAIRANEKYLIVPMSDAAGQLRAVQAISGDGKVKSFMRGAQKKGTMFVLGASTFDEIASSGAAAVAYVEGAATGVSFQGASGMPVVVCFDAGNLEEVAKQTAGRLPASITRIMAVDNDQFFVERAAGMLSEKLGLNPHSPGGQTISVRAGAASERALSLGEIEADGQWHQTSRGSYCVALKREGDSDLVNSVVVEVVPNGGRMMTATYQNRGVEAGIAGVAAIAQATGDVAAEALLVMPEFKSLAGRPTDWNDLYQAEGTQAIKALLPRSIERAAAPTLPVVRVGENRRLASLSR